MFSSFIANWIFFSIIIGICFRKSPTLPTQVEWDQGGEYDPCWPDGVD
jgi:hypothetical protein